MATETGPSSEDGPACGTVTFGSTPKMIAAKGAKSVKVQKVKGHATDDMVAAGQLRGQDKRGNDKADQAAGKGAKTSKAACIP